jgi:hypothetical protein
MANFKTMTHSEMQALVKKGFSFDALSNHPNLIYRRTMMKRREQILRMIALLEGTTGTVTGRISSHPQIQQLKVSS